MADLNQQISFGGSITPEAENPEQLLALARAIDDAGLEFIGIQDHPYNARFLDTWTLIATLAQATQQVRLFTNVANLPLRPPAMLAKAAATLDLLSGGRFELGIGAGYFWEGIEAMGGPTRTPGEAVDALEEAIEIIKAFWSEARTVRFSGEHYQVDGARAGPKPAHLIGIWVGAYGPRMLALTGRLGDGWIPSMSYAPPRQLPDMQRRIDDAAHEAGRRPEAIRRAYNIAGQITRGASRGLLNGPVDQWIEEITRFAVELGMDTFIFWPAEDLMRQFELFAAEVAPAVREAVARERERV